MREKTVKVILILIIGMALCGCGGKPQEPAGPRKRIKKIKKQEIVKPEKKAEETVCEYGGLKYRSPFSASGRTTSTEKITVGQESAKTVENPENLIVTGLFTDKKGKYAILSGVGEFYIVKQGRLYNEDEDELQNIAAVIKKDKVILITDKNMMYELPIPE